MSGKKPITGRTGVFIDFSNLFWQIKMIDPKTSTRTNYDICFIKLHDLLKTEHSPIFYNVYACQDNNAKQEPYLTKAAKHEKFLRFLEGTGYSVLRKDLKHIGSQAKCDTDVEITMDLHKYASDIDNIVLFSGDSDFLMAVKYFQSVGKYIHVYSFKSGLSWELKMFAMQNPRCNFTLLDGLRNKLERVKVTHTH